MFPDAEALVIDWLLAETAVTALVGTRIYTSIPESSPYPLIRVTRVGGPPTSDDEDAPLVQVDAWADEAQQDEAADVSRQVVDAVPNLDGQRPSGSWVKGPHVVNGPYYAQDEGTHKPRYLVEIMFWTYPED